MRRSIEAAAAATLALAGLACVRGAVTPDSGPIVRLELGAAADSMLSRYGMYGMSGSVLLSEGGQVVLEKGYGLADREHNVPATAVTRYDVGSITKTFTAAAVLRLVAQARVRLDQPVAEALGDTSRGAPTVTIHEVLTHTAGFPLDPSEAGVALADSPEEYVLKVLRYDLSRTRGRYSYSNTGYGLLAILVERVTGTQFRRFVDDVLLTANGLSVTTWWRDSLSLRTPGVARGYQLDEREGALVPESALVHANERAPLWSKWPLGAAGIISTVGDLHRWMGALEMGRVLPDSLRRAAFTPVAGNAGNQGYGWTISPRGDLGTRVYRGGARGGFTSLLASYPQRGVHVVFALNQSQDAQWQSIVWNGLERLLGGARSPLPPPTVSLAQEELGRFVGSYALGQEGRIRVIGDGGEFLVGAEGQEAVDALLNRSSRPEDSLLNRRSIAIIADAMEGRGSDSALSRVNNAAELTAWLRIRAPPGVAPTVLGTSPHPSGRDRSQTFVRLGAEQLAPVVRLIWDKDRVLAWGDGIRLPALRRFRPTSRESAVAFTAREPAWTTITLVDRAGSPTHLVVVAHAGARGAPAIKLP